MFIRSAVQGAVDERATLPHKASTLSPYAFELRPVGFPAGVPNYRVLVERAAFRLRAIVVPDYLAVSIVAAVASGARHNPERVARLRAAIAAAGWQPEIEISDEAFRIEAVFRDVIGTDEEELVDSAVTVGLMLSEFVLDQLIVTKPAGEMRPAIERSVGSEPASDVWLYDPSERDRATQVHRSLENWLMSKLRDRSIDPMDPAGEPFFDLAWATSGRLYVCEVKSSANNEVQQLRLGLGQILQYRHTLARSWRGEVLGALLVEDEPADPQWLDLCTALGVVLFWPARWDDVADQLAGGSGR